MIALRMVKDNCMRSALSMLLSIIMLGECCHAGGRHPVRSKECRYMVNTIRDCLSISDKAPPPRLLEGLWKTHQEKDGPNQQQDDSVGSDAIIQVQQYGNIALFLEVVHDSESDYSYGLPGRRVSAMCIVDSSVIGLTTNFEGAGSSEDRYAKRCGHYNDSVITIDSWKDSPSSADTPIVLTRIWTNNLNTSTIRRFSRQYQKEQKYAKEKAHKEGLPTIRSCVLGASDADNKSEIESALFSGIWMATVWDRELFGNRYIHDYVEIVNDGRLYFMLYGNYKTSNIEMRCAVPSCMYGNKLVGLYERGCYMVDDEDVLIAYPTTLSTWSRQGRVLVEDVRPCWQRTVNEIAKVRRSKVVYSIVDPLGGGVCQEDDHGEQKEY